MRCLWLWLVLLLGLMAEGAAREVEPLLGIVRSQKEPFNWACPLYVYEDSSREAELPLSGCVAASLESVMTFYGYPDEVCDTLWGWTTDHYSVDTIASGTVIEWGRILDEYVDYSDAEGWAVANLTYWIGIGVGMTWSPTASGASMSRAASSLRQHWGYGYVRCLSAVDYSPERWWELLDAELDEGRPVVYSGYTALAQGHAFVVDGRSEDGMYHVCWGYGGQYDGWFDLCQANTYENPLYPSETGRLMGHSINQEMIVMAPDSLDYCVGDTLEGALENWEVEEVSLVRSADCNGWVEASVSLTNLGEVERTAVLIFIDADVDEEDPFENGTTLGLAGGCVGAGETVELTGYLCFAEAGQRLFGISTGDTLWAWVDTVEVEAASGKGVEIAGCSLLDVGSSEACFAVGIRNESETAWSGQKLTYSLFEGDYTEDEGDTRQWRVLNLEPGGEMVDTVNFYGLSGGTDYTFVVRNTWLPAAEVAFRTEESAVSGVKSEERGVRSKATGLFDVWGRRVGEGSRGIVIVDGKKIVKE